jgi:cytoskeletal protein RodZ
MTDVHKYLRGELSAREMHALEMAALDDPFLADALEGLATRAEMPPPPIDGQLQSPSTDRQALAPSPLEQDLSELRARLDERIAEKKNRLILAPWMKMAAVVILLVGLGLTGWFRLGRQTKDKADLTKNTPPPAAADVATAPKANPALAPPAETAAASPVASAHQLQPPSTAARARVARAYGSRATASRPVESPAAAPPAETGTPLADSLAATASAGLQADAEKNLTSVPTRTVKKDTVYYKAELFANSKPALHAEPLLFAGQVRDANNHPLAGVSLVLEGKNKGTVTDQEGYFKLYVPPRDTVRKLNVEVPGFDEASVALNNDDRLSNVITLREHRSTLNEVVVTGLGMKRKETIAAPPSDDLEKLDSLWTRATPTNGRAAYLDYLAAGKQNLGADSTIRGTVSISFLVDQKGTLSEFKIEQSLSPVQDAGIIRLISEGPSWKLLRGKKARLLVSVSFP